MTKRWKLNFVFLAAQYFSLQNSFDCIGIIFAAVIISSQQFNCSLKPLPPFSRCLLHRHQKSGTLSRKVANSVLSDPVHFFMISS